MEKKGIQTTNENVRLNEVCITPKVNNAMGAKVKKKTQLNLTGRLWEGFTDIWVGLSWIIGFLLYRSVWGRGLEAEEISAAGRGRGIWKCAYEPQVFKRVWSKTKRTAIKTRCIRAWHRAAAVVVFGCQI